MTWPTVSVSFPGGHAVSVSSATPCAFLSHGLFTELARLGATWDGHAARDGVAFTIGTVRVPMPVGVLGELAAGDGTFVDLGANRWRLGHVATVAGRDAQQDLAYRSTRAAAPLDPSAIKPGATYRLLRGADGFVLDDSDFGTVWLRPSCGPVVPCFEITTIGAIITGVAYLGQKFAGSVFVETERDVFTYGPVEFTAPPNTTARRTLLMGSRLQPGRIAAPASPEYPSSAVMRARVAEQLERLTALPPDADLMPFREFMGEALDVPQFERSADLLDEIERLASELRRRAGVR